MLVVLLCASDALATPYDVYGAGARGAAMGAQTADAQGAEALYYNVSQLASAPAGLTLGIVATFGRPEILLKDRPQGYGVPDIGPPATSLADDLILRERSDSQLDAPLAGLSIGVVAPLVFEGLQSGLLIFLPMPTPVTLGTYYADERERYFSNQLRFERLGARVNQLDLEFGFAYEVTQWLSVGVGASYLPGFAVNSGIYSPDATDQATAEVNAEVETENSFGLLAGFTVELPANLSVALSFRDAVALRLSAENELQANGVTDGEPIVQVAEWTPIYDPGRAALGVAWRPGDWTFAGDLRYTLWSDYEGAQGDRAGFSNIFSGALGAEWRYTESTALRFGLGYDPSPVPEQSGRTNYVDNHRLNVSVGAGHAFEVGKSSFDVAWHIRLQGLVRRETVKTELSSYPQCADGVTSLCDEIPDDLIEPISGQPFAEARGLQTGNPGFPGWVSGGWMGSLGVELRY